MPRIYVFSLERVLPPESPLHDDQQLLQQKVDELRLEIDNLKRQHVESIEIERSAIVSNHEILIEQMKAEHQQETEHIRQGKHCVIIGKFKLFFRQIIQRFNGNARVEQFMFSYSTSVADMMLFVIKQNTTLLITMIGEAQRNFSFLVSPVLRPNNKQKNVHLESF